MRRIPLSLEVKKVLKLLMGTLFALLLATSSYFFIKTSATAERGYSFRENQVKYKELESANRLLKQRVLEAQSITELKSSEFVEEMVAPEKTIYVLPHGPLSKGKKGPKKVRG